MNNSGVIEPIDFGDSQWEDLRKEARRLESQVDVKLAAFSKLVASGQSGEASSSSGPPQPPPLQRAAELEAMLQRLSDLNEAMAGALSGPPQQGGGMARRHTVARHRDILGEFTQEFRRTRGMVVASVEHSALLTGARTSGGGFINADGSEMQSASNTNTNLLRERTAIHSSATQLDHIIGQAQATMGALTEQRSLFEGMSSKMSQIGEKFPAMGLLLNAIRRKKSKDTLVLSAVIAICLLFMFTYAW
eukprot:CAMPEP_0196586774 /NCGR_PEP_ID=MMETSP1081-20130531/55513_1 /TAXON_ID=36882 /ORGANISM="Pyramimonas amylifera, Strain CCMP720" /LENGTH=247 /DNA_ID=CAMNT_0041908761 /DNA_START=81 /DNA_END=821 /DNA_ORIENTATION=-